MTDMDNRRQAIAGYALIGGFVALFIVLNWAGPGRVLSLVSAVAVVATLLAIRTRSRLAVIAAVVLLVTLPFVALRTHAGSAVGAIGPLVMFVGVACWQRWRAPAKPLRRPLPADRARESAPVGAFASGRSGCLRVVPGRSGIA